MIATSHSRDGKWWRERGCSSGTRHRQGALVLGALGVVFGDIGTGPICTVQTVFNPDDPHPVGVSTDSVLGIVSLIFWSVTIIVTVTYVLFVMRADNDGEGGIMALITLIRPRLGAVPWWGAILELEPAWPRTIRRRPGATCTKP
jgi:K+ transporter